LGIPTPPQTLCLKARRKIARVKGIKSGTEIITNKEEVGRRISEFWSNLFGSIRDYDPDLLNSLIEEHQGKFQAVENKIVMSDKMKKLLNRTNRSCWGADGIPFLLIKASSAKLLKMWVALIQEAGEDVAWGHEFLKSQLCLLPKVDTGFPTVEQFCSICITNSDYRVVMRYWAGWLSTLTNDVLSNKQHSLLPVRQIDNAIDKIHNRMMEGILENGNITMLQTDFFKAYDYVNREGLTQVLEKMNTPIQIRNLAKKILIPSEILMPKRADEEEVIIWSRTGVRQGCPISPLLFIIILDLLVRSLENGKTMGDCEAYIDDLAVILNSPDNLQEAREIFKRFEQATGVKLNYEKCFVLCPNKKFTP
jgi:hypothetical protein